MRKHRGNKPSPGSWNLCARTLLALVSLLPPAVHAAGLSGTRPTLATPRPVAAPPILPDADAWIGEGLAHNAAGRYQEALEAFLNAVAIEPQNSFAYFNLGTAAALLGRYREAAGYLEEAVRISPDLLPAWSNLGAMYNQLGEPQKAVAAFRQVLRMQPENADARYRCGLALLALGRTAEARGEYEALKKLDPALAARLGEKLPQPEQ